MKSSQAANTFILYKIYSENCLLYIGTTMQPLQTRLHGHFFKEPMHRGIYIDCVTRIEYAELSSEADAKVYEIYFINKLKPVLNRDNKVQDKLTISLPALPFREYNFELLKAWKDEIHLLDMHDSQKKKRKQQLLIEHYRKEKEIYSDPYLTNIEKQELFQEWVNNYYEPARNALI